MSVLNRAKGHIKVHESDLNYIKGRAALVFCMSSVCGQGKYSNPTYAPRALLAGCLFGLLSDSEDGGSTFLHSVCILLPEYTASHHRR
jgi:hypothetical protein